MTKEYREEIVASVMSAVDRMRDICSDESRDTEGAMAELGNLLDSAADLAHRYNLDKVEDVLPLAKVVVEEATLHGDFLLKSGVRSSVYFDKYRLEADPAILGYIAIHLDELVPSGTEVFAGLELGGVPLATALALYRWTAGKNASLALVRKERKEYGTCNIVEGAEITGKHVLVVEDVITSGGSVIDAIRSLRAEGAIVDSVLCVIARWDVARGESGDVTFAKEHAVFNEIGVKVRALFTLQDLAPYLPRKDP